MASSGKESENGVYEFPYMRPQNTRSKWENFRLNIWDPSTNKFLGRNAKSWGQILLFYTIFYIVLAALFALCMKGLFSTLDDQRPKWLLDESLIGTNPGLGFRPISKITEEGSLIWYNAKSPKSIKKWTDLLDEYLENYYVPNTNQMNCDVNQKSVGGKVCAVDPKEWGACNKELQYGYNNSSPCIFLKLNRIYGWEADYYNDVTNLPKDMPDNLKQYIANLKEEERNQIWVSCQGENPADRELLQDFQYFPTMGFPGVYYPYTNLEGYLSPLVAVQIIHPKNSVLINIECRAWAKNIIYRGGNQQREGSVHFELLVDN